MEKQLASHNFIDLNGTIAVLTGGCQGIGLAIASELLSLGSHVVIVDILSEETAKEHIDQESTLNNESVTYFQADVSQFERAHEIIQSVRDQFQTIHILINNAGINRDHAIWKMQESEWDRVIDVNLKGAFNFSQAIAPIFREQQYGKIVNLTSINGLRGKFGQVNYASSKAGLIGMTKSLAKELGSSNVNVNAVAPGLIKTNMTKNLPEKIIQQALDESALKRIGQPHNVAKAVAFLCSEAAEHITGEIIKIDGGQYI